MQVTRAKASKFTLHPGEDKECKELNIHSPPENQTSACKTKMSLAKWPSTSERKANRDYCISHSLSLRLKKKQHLSDSIFQLTKVQHASGTNSNFIPSLFPTTRLMWPPGKNEFDTPELDKHYCKHFPCEWQWPLIEHLLHARDNANSWPASLGFFSTTSLWDGPFQPTLWTRRRLRMAAPMSKPGPPTSTSKRNV